MSKQQVDSRSPAAPAGRRRWRTVDIVVTAVLGVAFGVVFWAWGHLWATTGAAFTAFPPAQAFMYGVWLVPGVLAMLIIRRPGAAVFAMLVAAMVSALLGTTWGVQVIWYGLIEGLAPELVFAAFAYRRFGLPVILPAAAAAGLSAGLLDWFYYYRDWASDWVAVYIGLVVASAVVLAGFGSWVLTRALAATGSLDAFPAGRERELV